jgi:hypothetical protein
MSRVQQSLAALIAVLVVGAGIGAVVLRSDSSNGATANVSTPSTQPDGSTTTTPGGAAAPSTSTSKPTTTAAASAWHIPTAGGYRYRHSRTGAGAVEYDGSFAVAPVGDHGYVEYRDQGSVKATRYYSVDRGELRQTKFTVDTGTGPQTCQWDRPITVLPSIPKNGHEWTSKAACSFAIGDRQATTQIESTWKIVGIRQSKVGDITVPLLRVDGKSTASTTTSDGTIVRTSSFVEYYDTARGLLAQSTETAHETGPAGESDYRVIETLLTMQPEVPKQ